MFLRPDRPTEQKKDDSVKPSQEQEEKKDEANVEVNYEADSSDEEGPSALSVEPSTGQALGSCPWNNQR